MQYILGAILAIVALYLIVTIVLFLLTFALVGGIIGAGLGACLGTFVWLWHWRSKQLTSTPDEVREQDVRIKTIEEEFKRRIAGIDEEINQIIAGKFTTTPIPKIREEGKTRRKLGFGITEDLAPAELAVLLGLLSIIIVFSFPYIKDQLSYLVKVFTLWLK